MNREPDEQSLLTSVSRLRQAAPELSAALLSGPGELRRRILSRLVKEVTYLKEDRNISRSPWSCPIQMCLSGSRLPMISPRGEGPRSASQNRQCPGWEPFYLGRDFESPELGFVRALDVDD